MNFESPGPLRIEEIIQKLENRDYLLFLKNRLFNYYPSETIKEITHIQPRQSKVLKKNTKGLFEFSVGCVTIYTPTVFIYFLYSYNHLFDIKYKYVAEGIYNSIV